MNKLLIAAACAAVATAPLRAFAAPLPDADPALWMVKDHDTTVYLFGTFHALDGKADWFNDEVKQAFDASDELVIEAILPENPAELQPLVMKHGVDASGKPLTSKLSPKGRKELAEALDSLGVPAAAVDSFKPMFAATMIVSLGALKLGYSPEKGSEAILKAAAARANKPVGSLETADFQLGMFNQISEQAAIAALEGTLDKIDELPTMYESMKSSWYKGDAPGFVKLSNEMDRQSPEAYKVIFTDRNATWAQWIDDRLARPGTVFLAVGTGHLAGKNSVQELLAARKIDSRRIN